MNTTPIADAIRRIEDHIGDERYWCQGAFTKGSRHCLGWAVFQAPGWYGPAVRFMGTLLEDYAGHRSTVTFNDAPTTTHADVMLFLATALDVAEAEGL